MANKKSKEIEEIISTILYALPLAFGVAVVTLSILGEVNVDTLALFLGLSVFSLGLAGLNRLK